MENLVNPRVSAEGGEPVTHDPIRGGRRRIGIRSGGHKSGNDREPTNPLGSLGTMFLLEARSLSLPLNKMQNGATPSRQ